MNLLSQLTVEGFRSIRKTEPALELRPLNAFIGANGSGKSNLVDFFRMLNYALSRGLQDPYIRERGPASRILHFGPKTPIIRGELVFQADRGRNFYRFSLAHAPLDDTLLFTDEHVQFQSDDRREPTRRIPLGPGGHRESGLAELWSKEDPTARFVKGLVSRCRVYQFHDTSVSAHLRGKPNAEDRRFLYADAGNLAAVLLRMRDESAPLYQSVVRTLRLIVMGFDDFVLEPEGPTERQVVPLRWRMAGKGDYDLTAGQLSDGSLRAMALVTLLNLPEAMRPSIAVIDEPELGLHPVAEEIIAGQIRAASRSMQILVSTQSATFIDHFQPEDVVVTELEDGCTVFHRLSSADLAAWLKRYTLGQIWGKNLLGGRP